LQLDLELVRRVLATAMNRDEAGKALIRVIDSDRATLQLLQEWLRNAGYRVADENVTEAAALLIVDIPFTRHGVADRLHRFAEEHPGAQILALSPTFFSNVRCQGACAHSLGVAGVLAKPVARDSLLAAVHRLLAEAD
jgi:CheY-like chemotaxis protein